MKADGKGAVAFFLLSAVVMGMGAILGNSKIIEPSGFYWFSGGLFVLATYLALKNRISFNSLSIRL